LVDLKTKNVTISGIILVVKYGNLIDKSYREGLEFYKILFGPLFVRNLIVAITNAPGTKDWFEREESAVETIEKLKKMAKAILELDDVTVVYLDAKPFHKDTEIIERSKEIREFILDSFFTTQDQIEIENIKRENIGLQKSRMFAENQFQDISQEINNIDNRLIEIDFYLRSKTDKLIEIDNSSLKQIHRADFSDTWRLFSSASKDFDFRTDYKITSKIATQGYLLLEVDEEKRIKGKIYNSYLSNMNASLILYTTNQHFYEDEIKRLKESVHLYESDQEKLKLQFAQLTIKKVETSKQIEIIVLEINEKNQQFEECEKKYLTFEECQKRFAFLCKNCGWKAKVGTKSCVKCGALIETEMKISNSNNDNK